MNLFTPNPLTDKFSLHRAYLEFYAELLEPLLDSPWPVLEIGTAAGGGMMMWRDYFTQATIIGIDNNPIEVKDRRRFIHCQRDAYTPDCVQFMEEHHRPFCLIVDDAMHSWQTQVWMLPRYCHQLSEDGVLVIEDVQDETTFDRLRAVVPPHFIGEAFDLRSVNGQPDDLLFTVRRA